MANSVSCRVAGRAAALASPAGRQELCAAASGQGRCGLGLGVILPERLGVVGQGQIAEVVTGATVRACPVQAATVALPAAMTLVPPERGHRPGLSGLLRGG